MIYEFTTREHKFKRWFCTQNPVLNVRFKDFWYTKINLIQKYILISIIYSILSIINTNINIVWIQIGENTHPIKLNKLSY
jgi:hypothetical protein